MSQAFLKCYLYLAGLMSYSYVNLCLHLDSQNGCQAVQTVFDPAIIPSVMFITTTTFQIKFSSLANLRAWLVR